MEKVNKEYIEIFNEIPKLVARVSTNRNDTTVSFLQSQHYIKNVKEINKIPNLYEFEIVSNNKKVIAFIYDIVPACTSDLEDKRVQIKRNTDEMINYLKNVDNNLNIICGYCEFNNLVFCYNDEINFLKNETNSTTSVHIKLHWLFKSIKEKSTWILSENKNSDKFTKILISNDPNVILNCVDNKIEFFNNSKNINVFNRNSEDVLKYKTIISSLTNHSNDNLENEELIKQTNNLNEYNNLTFDDIKPFSELLKNNIETNNFSKTSFSKTFSEISMVLEQNFETIIDPLKIEMLFDNILKNEIKTRNDIMKIMKTNYVSHKWINSEKEAFLQYDFVINDNIFVDIKSTWKNKDLTFYISELEQKFRESISFEKNKAYFIILFYDIQINRSGQTISYKIKILSNDEIKQLTYKTSYQYYIGDTNE